MITQTQEFRGLVDDAYVGKLRLPEFQRDWKWTRPKVAKLFDSIRKNYPLGGFLTLEASDKLPLSPRFFEGVKAGGADMETYVLDGQQRVTAGLALYYGTGGSHYFLDLGKLWDLATEKDLNFDDSESLQEFAEELDDEDKYIKGQRRASNPQNLLRKHLMWTPFLAGDFKFSDARDQYLEDYPDRTKFIDKLVPLFKIQSRPTVPVTVLDASMSVVAITRVFSTLNTSGQRLTPVEIVTAVLFPHGISLRQEIDSFKGENSYYRNIETTGEIFLQTVALKDKQTPKKTSFPKTITPRNFTKYKKDAVMQLDEAGKFLSKQFGMGLDASNQLVSYDAMLPPLAIALAEARRHYTQPSAKERWEHNIERWFIGSILKQRYTESQPATQQRDTKELLQWIEEGDDRKPEWLEDIRYPSLAGVEGIAPTSARGKLIAFLISKQNPLDPYNKKPVGGCNEGTALASAQSHHIFPKAFCEVYIPGWERRFDKYELALNIMPLTQETNVRWSKMNPFDQVADVRNEWGSEELTTLYKPFFIDGNCLKIMEKPNKTKEDFKEFISARGKLIEDYIAEKWGFISDAQQHGDDENEDI